MFCHIHLSGYGFPSEVEHEGAEEACSLHSGYSTFGGELVFCFIRLQTMFYSRAYAHEYALLLVLVYSVVIGYPCTQARVGGSMLAFCRRGSSAVRGHRRLAQASLNGEHKRCVHDSARDIVFHP